MLRRVQVLCGLLSVMVLFALGGVVAQSDLQANLEAFLQGIASEEGYAISALIATGNGEEVTQAAVGLVDITKSQAARPSDRFRIASMSKTFLAVALLLLEEDGVLSMEDGLSQWLDPSVYERLPNADEVTLYHLVTMRSGMPDYLGDEFFGATQENPTKTWTPEEVLVYAYDSEALFAPDEGYDYSNTNYLLLHLVVESATGQTLAEVFRERIFDPLKMADTYTQVAETLAGGFVHGYEDIDGDGVNEDVTDINDGAGLGDGGLVSTTADLARFYKALLIDKTLLSEASLEKLLAPTDDENNYGMGIEARPDDDYGTVYGHTGSVFGFSGAAFYASDADVLAIIFYAYQGLEDEHIYELLSLAQADE